MRRRRYLAAAAACAIPLVAGCSDPDDGSDGGDGGGGAGGMYGSHEGDDQAALGPPVDG